MKQGFEKKTQAQERIEKMNRMADYLILGILFLFSIFPIITVGVAISALYKSIYDYQIQEKLGVIKLYGRAFKNSFKQSTIIWGIYLILMIAFLLNRRALLNEYSLLLDAIQIFHIILILLMTPIVVFMLMYIGRFTDPLKTVLKNSILILLLNPFKALTILFFSIITLVTIWLVPILGMFLPPFFVVKGMRMIEDIFGQFRINQVIVNE